MTGLRYTDRGPSFRISPKRSSPPSPYGECSEAAQLHSIASDQGVYDLIENGIYSLFNVLAEETRRVAGCAPSNGSAGTLAPKPTLN